MDIYLSKTVCSNLEIDNETIGVYVALRGLYRLEKPIMYVNDFMLCYELLGSSKVTRRFKEKIHNGLDNIIKLGLVSIIESIGKNEYILDLSKLFIGKVNDTKEYYISVSSDEIHKIFSVDQDTDKFALCRYFIQMIGTINFSQGVYTGSGSGLEMVTNFVGFQSQEKLAKISGISRSSVVNYNAILEQLEIIYIFNCDGYIRDDIDGTIKSPNNHYGRFSNAELIKQFALQYIDVCGIITEHTKHSKEDTNRGRSLSQKYNALCKGKEYSLEEIREIYDYIHGKNEELMDKIKDVDDKYIIESCMDRYRSEECFAPYLFALKQRRQDEE